MRRVTRAAAYAGTTAVLFAASLSAAGTATAADAPNCTPTQMCVYQASGYGGEKYFFSKAIRYGQCGVLPYSMNSAANYTGRDQYVYGTFNCTGTRIHLCANGASCSHQVPNITSLLGRGGGSIGG
jgi:hypothetical protein